MYVCVCVVRASGDYKCFFTCDMSGALLNIYIYISLQLERFQSVYLNKKDELYNFPK
jgi:hypothetical protein